MYRPISRVQTGIHFACGGEHERHARRQSKDARTPIPRLPYGGLDMKPVTPQSARAFLNAMELPPSTRGGFESAAEIIDFKAQKDQALVVASDVVSFVKGVTNERRQDIVNASLLAQLAANKKVPDKTNMMEWYNAYFNVLENIGWVLQDKTFSSYTEEADGLEAHEAILKVAAVFLGAAPAALTVLTSTLQALKSMDPSKSWVTIFDRESKHVETAHFQIALAEQGEHDQFFVSLMAFSLKAKSTLTQVLFFKIRKDDVELKKYSGKVTINDQVLSSIRDRVQQKIASHVGEFVADLEI